MHTRPIARPTPNPGPIPGGWSALEGHPGTWVYVRDDPKTLAMLTIDEAGCTETEATGTFDARRALIEMLDWLSRGGVLK